MIRLANKSEVRRSVLWNLPLGQQNVEHVIKRSRDVDYNVRKSVYLRLCDESFQMNFLTKQQRTMILKYGLNDRLIIHMNCDDL